jgi:hypothetical protein
LLPAPTPAREAGTTTDVFVFGAPDQPAADGAYRPAEAG